MTCRTATLLCTILLLAACSPNDNPAPQTTEAPAPKLLEEQRQVLDQAKQVAAEQQKQAEEQRKAIEQQTQ